MYQRRDTCNGKAIHLYELKMKKEIFLLAALSVVVVLSGCAKHSDSQCADVATCFSDEIEENAVMQVTDAAVRWQRDAYPRMNEKRKWKSSHDVSWENAIFLTAVCEWSLMRGDTAAAAWVRNIARRNDYRLPMGVHVYHADNMIVGMLYADLFEQDGDERVLHQTIARLEFVKNHPSQCSLKSDDSDPTYYYKQRWSWCDALYMAPQVFARYAQLCNNPELLSFMDNEYHATADYLYSPEYKLFFRDSNYFDKLETNGKPVFWGRGNGWVVAGLAKLIPYLPADFEGREWYVSLFKDMMGEIVSRQSPEGHWYVSMLDPQSYPAPEMSSTAFFCYALWWGMNNNILDKDTYMPHAVKAWQAIVCQVHADGMLGSVQAVGEKPENITPDMTEVYGPAAMVFAAQEILKSLK